MDIRTKLALALVSVALVSMFILGAFAYSTAADLLEEISIRQLDALAESKMRDLEKVQEGWRDQLRLIKGRTPLATSLQSYLTSGDEAARQDVLRVIEDAATAVDDVDQIRILSLQGEEIVSYGRIVASYEQRIPSKPGDVVFNDSFPTNTDGARVVYSSLIVGDTSPIGVIEVVFDAFEIGSVTDNYTGLGDTGEVMVAMMEGPDSVLILNSLRHESAETTSNRLMLEDVTKPMRQALSGTEVQKPMQAVDYRDVEVLAATRHMPATGWGVVVKIDVDEENTRAIRLRDAMFDIALALSAFAIVGGTMLGFYLARPIHGLAVMVERVRHGETDLRVDVKGDDEIAFLADSVNELLDHVHPEVDDDRPESS